MAHPLSPVRRPGPARRKVTGGGSLSLPTAASRSPHSQPLAPCLPARASQRARRVFFSPAKELWHRGRLVGRFAVGCHWAALASVDVAPGTPWHLHGKKRERPAWLASLASFMNIVIDMRGESAKENKNIDAAEVPQGMRLDLLPGPGFKFTCVGYDKRDVKHATAGWYLPCRGQRTAGYFQSIAPVQECALARCRRNLHARTCLRKCCACCSAGMLARDPCHLCLPFC